MHSEPQAPVPGIDRPHEALTETLAGLPRKRRVRLAQIVSVIVVVILIAMLVNTLLRNERFQWGVVGQYLFSRPILDGALITIELTVFAMLLAFVIGLAVSLMYVSSNRLLWAFAGFYIWIFRGTPLLVQILLWNFISALYPRLSLGIPFGPEFISFSANDIVSPILAGTLALGFNEGAYMAEIIRSGLLSVPRGQVEAADAVGLTSAQKYRWIILPQALRVIVPPTGNEIIGMLKHSSLVSVIAVAELLYSAQLIYSRNFLTIPLLLTSCIWYLVITSVLSAIQSIIEKRLAIRSA